MDRAEWNERYRTDELIWKAEPNRFLVEETGGLRPGRALDLACGEGRNAVWLAEQGWEVVGVDFSAVGLEKAARLAAARGVEVSWIEADVLEWKPPAESFDLVVVMYLQLPVDARRRALGRAATALSAGGALLVVGHDTTNLTEGTGGPQDPALLFSPDEIVDDLGGLVIERAERVRRPVTMGPDESFAIDALVRARRAPPITRAS